MVNRLGFRIFAAVDAAVLLVIALRQGNAIVITIISTVLILASLSAIYEALLKNKKQAVKEG